MSQRDEHADKTQHTPIEEMDDDELKTGGLSEEELEMFDGETVLDVHRHSGSHFKVKRNGIPKSLDQYRMRTFRALDAEREGRKVRFELPDGAIKTIPDQCLHSVEHPSRPICAFPKDRGRCQVPVSAAGEKCSRHENAGEE